MDPAFLAAAFVTLFVVIDPIGLAPLFVALTRGADDRLRRAIAIRACLIAVGLLTLFGLLGEAFLAVIGISMPAFQIAGGMLLFLTALDMLFERRTRRREDTAGAAVAAAEAPDADGDAAMPVAGQGAATAASQPSAPLPPAAPQDAARDDPAEDPSVFPLAMPLIAGPGAMASMILLTGQAGGDWLRIAAVHAVMLVVVALVFVLFRAAGVLERALGRIGTVVVTRLLGMLLAALSVQFVIDGLRAAGLFATGPIAA